jgi:hypothetical protein
MPNTKRAILKSKKPVLRSFEKRPLIILAGGNTSHSWPIYSSTE